MADAEIFVIEVRTPESPAWRPLRHAGLFTDQQEADFDAALRQSAHRMRRPGYRAVPYAPTSELVTCSRCKASCREAKATAAGLLCIECLFVALGAAELAAVPFRTFVREGLSAALLEVTRLFNGHGLEKHGPKKWRGVPWSEIRASLNRHRAAGSGAIDAGSGLPHRAHAISRELMLLQQELEEVGRG